MTGGYLRTNWRNTTSILKTNAIGAGYQLGSYAGGPGANFPNGGFIVMSVNGSTSDYGGASTAIRIVAISAMNLFYGSDGGGAPLVGGTSGFKIIPINAYLIGSHAASGATSGSTVHIWASITTSDDSNIDFYLGESTVSAGTSAAIQAHFVWTGFIVSGP